MKYIKYVILLIFLSSNICFSDAPVKPPVPYTTCSTSKEYCVDFKFKEYPGSGVAYKVDKYGKRLKLWQVNNWIRLAFLSDNGEYLISCNDGLISAYTLESAMNSEIIHVYKNGDLIKNFKVKDIISNKKMIQRTVSHYAWGGCIGLTSDLLTIRTLNNKKITIDITKIKSQQNTNSQSITFSPWQQIK